jgi:ABC-type transport system substrate-binding protein
VVEAYGDDVQAHPVGTGPYVLKEWRARRRSCSRRIPITASVVGLQGDERSLGQGRRRCDEGQDDPEIGRVEISIIEEDQSRWLAFTRKELDWLALPATFRQQVFDASNKVKPEWTDQGVTLFKSIDPDIAYTFFNFRDPIVGGFSKEKIALRRAIIMGYDLDEEIRVIRKYQAVQAQMPIPYGVVGFDSRYRSINQYDPVLANRLLDYFGYKRGPGGFRTLPDGKPLVLKQATGTSANRPRVQRVWKKSMDAIGILWSSCRASSPIILKARRLAS